MELLSLSSKGLYCAPGNFYIDPWSKVETALITHAHGDHARWGMGTYHCVEECQHVLLKRIPDANLKIHQYGETFWMNDVKVSFHPAGHILGSAQIRLEWKGEVWVFTGDFKRDDDLTCRPFEIVPCDVFISEATFSLPVYHWPSFREEMKKVYQWWMENREEGVNSVLCCYALGKAQRIIAGLRELTDEPIYVHGTIDELNHCYEKTGVSFQDVRKVPLEKELKLNGAMILCPPSALGSPWAKRLTPVKVGFASGWMRIRGNRRREGYDRGFVISDHADWPSLLKTVEETGAKRVLFTHGQTDSIIRYLKEKNVAAFDLKLPFETEEEN